MINEMFETKGIQNKLIEDGYYYKIDRNGYPSLSEYVVSNLYKYSNVDDYVLYDLEKININGIEFIASKSKNFLTEGDQLITLQELYKDLEGKFIEEDIVKIKDIHERIKYVVDFVEKNLCINNFGKYITLLLEIDEFFYNDDRHFFNISLIKNKNGIYRKSPIFDNGAMLLSATNVYKLDDSIKNNMNKYFSLPFSINPIEQKKAAEDLYGNIFFIKIDNIIIEDILKKANFFYEDKIIDRVRIILNDRCIRETI